MVEKHSYSFLRRPLAVMMSVQEDMVVPLKRAFLDIRCEENRACDCPNELEDWWQSSAARNFTSHWWQELTHHRMQLFVRQTLFLWTILFLFLAEVSCHVSIRCYFDIRQKSAFPGSCWFGGCMRQTLPSLDRRFFHSQFATETAAATNSDESHSWRH